MKKLILLGVATFGLFLVTLLVGGAVLAGCANAELKATARSAERTIERTTEVVGCIEATSNNEIGKIASIKENLDELKLLSKQLRSHKELRKNKDLLDEIQEMSLETRNSVEQIHKARRQNESRSRENNKRADEIDVNAIKQRHERTKKSNSDRVEKLDRLDKNLAELNKKLRIAMGMEDEFATPTEAVLTEQPNDFYVNITTGSPRLRRLPAIGNVDFTFVPSPSMSM